MRYCKRKLSYLIATDGAFILKSPFYSTILPLRLQRESEPTMHTKKDLINNMGIFQRPWRRVKKHDEAETFFFMVRRNCKVYANIGF